ncbi:hypothetical protein CC1G_12068 [Coprinopsis cinerea okayama7|uniref:Uncharacterized protein n=1 Tax=Coprinopsis cinerea (strain Okayama-7 / 130 / ATCC MYA-4618 / FGSC 9003) TaxID=240176 RepID=A8N0D7_COPC7|nr:hypothetical protein CC1G_12068 [Coprinopsis cinerea okayama7\|eukprot:XP_001828338.1 hypothetical protein CC1G_12068 [Coprinopsis cinerea okayama7\
MAEFLSRASRHINQAASAAAKLTADKAPVVAQKLNAAVKFASDQTPIIADNVSAAAKFTADKASNAASAAAKLAREKGPVVAHNVREAASTAAKFTAEKGPQAADFAVQTAKEYPKVVGAASAILAANLLAPAVCVGALGAIGFSPAGVVGGSIAAGVQSSVYGPFTAGAFSVLQSMGATAAPPAVAPIIGGVAAAGASVASMAYSLVKGEGSRAMEKIIICSEHACGL